MSPEVQELKDLAAMWEETAMIFEMGDPKFRSDAFVYKDCARDLRQLIQGNKSVIAKWQHPTQQKEQEV